MAVKTLFFDQGATFSKDRLYRYRLWRRWESASCRKVAFIMLNPSTADAETFDPTVRRCFGYARDWGFGSMEVVNLFALRSTYPEQLKKARDPVGPENDDAILQAVLESDLAVAAWGVHGRLYGRDLAVQRLVAGIRDLHCIGTTKAGAPLHPLHQPKKLCPVLYRCAGPDPDIMRPGNGTGWHVRTGIRVR
ncbi:MAG: hypothetical protein A4E28_01202 [Methanocella sp. PtaU1.Bin125]|nr:MAG: hypothetical protein A4E28_01202 [Methanocella sp. PtaU1.Bin125]